MLFRAALLNPVEQLPASVLGWGQGQRCSFYNVFERNRDCWALEDTLTIMLSHESINGYAFELRSCATLWLMCLSSSRFFFIRSRIHQDDLRHSRSTSTMKRGSRTAARVPARRQIYSRCRNGRNYPRRAIGIVGDLSALADNTPQHLNNLGAAMADVTRCRPAFCHVC